MISLSGSTRANSGSSFCVTASGVTGALSVKATIGGAAVSVTIKRDNVLHTATICVKVPKGALGGIEIFAADSSTPTYASHAAIIRLS